jgi:hypothetical protein
MIYPTITENRRVYLCLLLCVWVDSEIIPEKPVMAMRWGIWEGGNRCEGSVDGKEHSSLYFCST